MNSHNFYIYVLKCIFEESNLFRVYSCWLMWNKTFTILIIHILFVSNIIMVLHIKKLLKQLPFYGKTIKPNFKEFTNARLLPELPFFEKPIKAKIKQLTTNKLLQEQPFYKQPIKNHTLKN